MSKRVLVTVAAMGVAIVIAGTGLALAQSPRGALSDADHEFVMEAVEGGQMEVELGQLAQQKASDAVKQFGQRMATDHAKAGQELGVRCTEDQARELLESCDRAAAALEVRGDYERSPSCAQAAELIRRTLDRRMTT